MTELISNPSDFYADTLIDFFNYLKSNTKNHLTMGIGLSVLDPYDNMRKLPFDIKMRDYSSEKTELLEYLKKISEEKTFTSFILNFNLFNLTETNTINNQNE